jgi:hypothetical protein
MGTTKEDACPTVADSQRDEERWHEWFSERLRSLTGRLAAVEVQTFESTSREHKVLADVIRERDAYLANLTATQARANELLAENRAWRRLAAHLGGVSGLGEEIFAELLPLAERLIHARTKHPKGTDGWRSLNEELGEVAKAERHETPERVADELLDVATVAMRWRAGEVAK